MSEVTQVFDIEGMTCAACATRVQKAAAKVKGVTSANVNLLKNSMEIQFDGAPSTTKAVVAAVEYAGYGAAPRRSARPVGTGTAAAAADAGAAGAGAAGGQGAAESTAATSDLKATAELDFVDPQIGANKATLKKRHQLIWSLVFSVPLFYLAMGPMFGWPLPQVLIGHEAPMTAALAQLALALPVMFINRNYFVSGFKALRHAAPNMDSLIALGSAASFLYSVVSMFMIAAALQRSDMAAARMAAHGLYFDSAGMILTLITLGKFFEARAKGRTTSAISALMNLAPKEATLLVGGQEQRMSAAQVKVGDMLVVRTGEAIPCDGVVVEGTATTDESALTGESLPQEKRPGDQLTGATTLTSGYVHMRATAVGANTALAAIIALVDEATNTKAPIERQADKIAGIFVPIVLGITALTFAGWMLVLDPGNVATAFNFAVSVLVISCPCALGLATPTAIMVGTERGASNGIMIKSAEALEIAGSLDTVVFDKTGTLTSGEPRVCDVAYGSSWSTPAEKNLLLQSVLALESKSEHPLAQALVAYTSAQLPAKNRGAGLEIAAFEQVSGAGVKAQVGKRQVLIGNGRLMEQEELSLGGFDEFALELTRAAKTVLFVALDGQIAAAFGLADGLKDTSATAISALKRMGVHTVLLSGDAKRVAQVTGGIVGVDEVIAEVLPGEKEQVIRKLQARGKRIAMVGDGINDAPALARADVGIAIGAGTDVAIESADVVLMHSDPLDVVRAIELSRATMRNVKQNLFWALIYNVICIPVAMGLLSGLGVVLNPMIGAAAMGASSVFVVSNALRLFGWKSRVIAPAAEASSFSATSASTAAATNPHSLASPNSPAATSQDESSAHALAREIKIGAAAPQCDAANGKETRMTSKTLHIYGMSCQHCVAHVTKALEGVDGVSDVQVSLDTNSATLTVGEGVSDDALRQAVADAGYEVVSLT